MYRPGQVAIIGVLLLASSGCGTKQIGGLYGSRPAATLAAPEFAAIAQNGEPRSVADLKGHPTVIWFYPAAGSPG